VPSSLVIVIVQISYPLLHDDTKVDLQQHHTIDDGLSLVSCNFCIIFASCTSPVSLLLSR
jgi:hypothetical protein